MFYLYVKFHSDDNYEIYNDNNNFYKPFSCVLHLPITKRYKNNRNMNKTLAILTTYL